MLCPTRGWFAVVIWVIWLTMWVVAAVGSVPCSWTFFVVRPWICVASSGTSTPGLTICSVVWVGWLPPTCANPYWTMRACWGSLPVVSRSNPLIRIMGALSVRGGCGFQGWGPVGTGRGGWARFLSGSGAQNPGPSLTFRLGPGRVPSSLVFEIVLGQVVALTLEVVDEVLWVGVHALPLRPLNPVGHDLKDFFRSLRHQ